MRISIVIPAYNEERYLTDTVRNIRDAAGHFDKLNPANSIEVIVVDNESEDRTGELAVQLGCRVVTEHEHNISKVRNTGARAADGDVLVFIDADTRVPVEMLALIAAAMEDPRCIGGAVDVFHNPSKRLIRWYLGVWRWIGIVTRMAQGATQFCRKSDFHDMGGYDETLFMGEDVDFYWRMKHRAKETSREATFIDDVRVIPSPRRFDQWSIWKTLLMTNPLLILVLRRRKNAWTGWYVKRPR